MSESFQMCNYKIMSEHLSLSKLYNWFTKFNSSCVNHELAFFILQIMLFRFFFFSNVKVRKFYAWYEY